MIVKGKYQKLMKPKLHKLVVKNDWEVLTWLIDDNDVTNNLTSVSLMWPDKTVTEHKVSWVDDIVDVYDMGNHYTQNQSVAYVDVMVFGAKFPHRLDTLPGVKIYAYEI